MLSAVVDHRAIVDRSWPGQLYPRLRKSEPVRQFSMNFICLTFDNRQKYWGLHNYLPLVRLSRLSIQSTESAASRAISEENSITPSSA
jgi:hypothetical protein